MYVIFTYMRSSCIRTRLITTDYTKNVNEYDGRQATRGRARDGAAICLLQQCQSGVQGTQFGVQAVVRGPTDDCLRDFWVDGPRGCI